MTAIEPGHTPSDTPSDDAVSVRAESAVGSIGARPAYLPEGE